MRLFVGLGNPGKQYQLNRHNIGFMALDVLVERHKFSGWAKKFQGEIADGTLGGEKILLLKPQTFMNLSGQSVQGAAAFYKIKPEDIVVFHDELDLAPGKLRVKKGGGAAGHNGLRSIDEHLGKDYWRVRLGIGHPGDRDMVSPYVLGNFAKADENWLLPMMVAVSDRIELLASGDDGGFMTKVAQDTAPPKPEKPKPEKQKPAIIADTKIADHTKKEV